MYNVYMYNIQELSNCNRNLLNKIQEKKLCDDLSPGGSIPSGAKADVRAEACADRADKPGEAGELNSVPEGQDNTDCL